MILDMLYVFLCEKKRGVEHIFLRSKTYTGGLNDATAIEFFFLDAVCVNYL